VRGVTVLGSYESRSTLSILLGTQYFFVSAKDIERPSPPTPLPEGEGRSEPSAVTNASLVGTFE
jgi:hypothetical protein